MNYSERMMSDRFPGAARAPQATMNSRNQGALARATRSITAALFTLQLSFAALANPPVRAARADFERILARDTLRWLEEYGVPGVAIALIEKGEVTLAGGYGFANVAERRPVTADTIFNAGSISKPFTSWGVMRLVEQRKLALDAPIDSYLHAWHLPPSNFDTQQVTARRLLSHTAGISEHGYGGSDPARARPSIVDSLTGKSGTGDVRLIAPPGSGFRYSGANFRILELAIEETSGRSFPDYMQTEVVEPLRLARTRFGLPSNYATEMATPYDSLGEPLPILAYNDLSAAGLTISVRDLAAFAAQGLRNRALLSPATRALMYSPVAGTQWSERDPLGPRPTYGLGHTVRPAQLGAHTGIGHGGSNNGWESLFQIIPDTRAGIVVMTNSSNGTAMISAVLCAWRAWQAGGAAVECPTIDARVPLYAAYRRGGTAAVVASYAELRKAPRNFEFGVSQLNGIGYTLMRRGNLTGALDLFELNAATFPDNWNVHDSLGEARLKAGDRAGAVASYRRSLALNSGNDNAREVLKQLGE